MQSIKKQKGLTFVSWLVVAGIFIFIAVTVVKVVPLYIKYNTVKTIVDDIAADPKNKSLKKRAIMAKVDRYADISFIDLTSDNFEIEKVRNSKKSRKLSIKYEDRVNWFANLSIVADFEYSAIIGEKPEE